MLSTRRTTSNRPQLAVALAATLALLALGACSTGGGSDASGTTTTTEKTTTTAKTSTTDGGGSTSTTAKGGASAATWRDNAQAYKGKVGSTVKVDCPPDGTPGTISGIETYSDDSSICTAAVHVGLITLAKGGPVSIAIAAGRDSYDGGTANGITSTRSGAGDTSFTFPKAPPGSGSFATAATWSDSAKSLNLGVGESKTVTCAGGGSPSSVWGTTTYTADSSICSAAVLQGLITKNDGGSVAVKVIEGQDSYQGSTANGVTSSDYGTYALSYTLEAATAKG